MVFANKGPKDRGSLSHRRCLKSPGSRCELVVGLEICEINPANNEM
jgi:hypothetical protein